MATPASGGREPPDDATQSHGWKTGGSRPLAGTTCYLAASEIEPCRKIQSHAPQKLSCDKVLKARHQRFRMPLCCTVGGGSQMSFEAVGMRAVRCIVPQRAARGIGRSDPRPACAGPEAPSKLIVRESRSNLGRRAARRPGSTASRSIDSTREFRDQIAQVGPDGPGRS